MAASPPSPASDDSELVRRLRALATDDGHALIEPMSKRRVSLGALLREAGASAEHLRRDHGVRPGDRVVVLVPSGIDWARAFFAVLLAGAAVVALPVSAPRAEIEYFVNDSGARVAIASTDLAGLLPADVTRVDPGRSGEADGTFMDAGASAAALILYTSGTTGRPKGAVLTHANLAAQTSALREAWGFSTTDVLLHALPMHHLHGVVVAFLTAVTTPADVHMLPRFDAAHVTDALADASVFMAVPTMYQRLVDHVATLDDARRRAFEDAARALRLATSGSAALPVSLAERWRGITGSIPLERYGMTEIGMALSNPLEAAGRRAGTVGRVLPSVELRIVGDDDEDGDGPGELFVRGPSVMAGYLGREESTRAAFREGWFMTGDIGVRDREGHVKLLGRASSDILKSGGEKVSALEVEEVLREHDAIAEVAVVGVPDEVWGDRIVAAIVPREGRAAACSTDGLRAWAKARLAPFKVPKLFVAVDALPRNAMGKVMKPDLVRRLRDKGD